MKPLRKEMLEAVFNKKIESKKDLEMLQDISTRFDSQEEFEKGMKEMRGIFEIAAKNPSIKILTREDMEGLS